MMTSSTSYRIASLSHTSTSPSLSAGLAMAPSPHSVLRVNLPTPPVNSASQASFTRQVHTDLDMELHSARSHSVHSNHSNEKTSHLELELPPRDPSAPFTPFQADDEAGPTGFYDAKDGPHNARRPSMTSQPRKNGRMVVVAMAEADRMDVNNGLRRTLTSRHIQFIAFSGVLGSGLFLGSGSAIVQAGPIGALLCYGIVASVAYSVSICLAELTAFAPVAGGFASAASRWVDPAAGFTTGWFWWYSSAANLPTQVIACQALFQYWSDAEWLKPFLTTVLLVSICITTLLPARIYGDLEVMFGSIKLLVAIGLILMGLLIDWGANPQGDAIGFRYWIHPGPVASYLLPGASGRLVGIIATLTQASFSFQGIELVSICAGEARSPRRSIATASHRLFWRITTLYMFGLLVAGLLVPSDDENLTNDDNSGTALYSPFVIAIKRAGISGLPSVVNACIVLSAFSCGSAWLFGSSRLLQGLAARGQAPGFFKRTTRSGMPLYAIAGAASLGLLAYLNLGPSSAEVFSWFYNITTQAGYITWLVIAVTTVRFQAGMKAQGLDRTRLLYHGPFQPYAAYWATGWLVFLILTAGFTAFIGDEFDTKTFVTAYIGLPFAAILYFGYKWKEGTSIWKAEEMDFVSGVPSLAETEEDELPPKTTLERLWRKY